MVISLIDSSQLLYILYDEYKGGEVANFLSPRTYQLGRRQAATNKTRERILAAARELLLGENFSAFTMEAVARAADVSRLTVYYQFDSKAGLLEELYNYIARRGDMKQLAKVFRQGGDPLKMLHDFIRAFAQFWASDREVIRRLHALGAIDAEIGQSLRARNERRRNGLLAIVKGYCDEYPPLTSLQLPIAIDTLHMLTSFETFDALAGSGRSLEEVVKIIRQMADRAIGFTPPFVAPH
jgi:AcrR family transcriptional regulator